MLALEVKNHVLAIGVNDEVVYEGVYCNDMLAMEVNKEVLTEGEYVEYVLAVEVNKNELSMELADRVDDEIRAERAMSRSKNQNT